MLGNNHTPTKKNVFGGILQSACLSVCVSVHVEITYVESLVGIK